MHSKSLVLLCLLVLRKGPFLIFHLTRRYHVQLRIIFRNISFPRYLLYGQTIPGINIPSGVEVVSNSSLRLLRYVVAEAILVRAEAQIVQQKNVTEQLEATYHAGLLVSKVVDLQREWTRHVKSG
ncbi:hypothetical protein K469DRAFT_253125 [Zopfia rhizophila CBS 207.26]|uniref:Secreted protein n=1 Tax=Zopfia rhizophila CBS 207.26 TaxID=1314779 RepID=A0A6A6DR78_9PEZI|nr:hypothetical protein K469DRAFT_253125 [Zopfia rhizophila CBS 207.26]